MLVISIVLMTILVLLVNKTKIGLVMKASEQNIVAANLVGIKVNSVISFIFILVGLSAAVASILVSSYYGMTYPNIDRKSTRLNSSHVSIYYAVFCLHKKI